MKKYKKKSGIPLTKALKPNWKKKDWDNFWKKQDKNFGNVLKRCVGK